MAEQTQATAEQQPQAAELLLEEPQAITIDIVTTGRKGRWRNNAYRLETSGFTVVGTNRLFAVYNIPLKVPRWGLAHVPSGAVVFAKFRTREEAEEFASWMWLNAQDRAGLESHYAHDVQMALGPRVRGRAVGGKILHGVRSARERLLDTSDDSTPVEQRLKLRCKALENLVAYNEQEHTARITAINEKDRLIDTRLRAVEAEQAEQARIRTSLDNRTEQLHADLRALAEQRENIYRMEYDLNINIARARTLRQDLLTAIAVIADDTNNELPATRTLRGIRLRGDPVEEVTENEPAF